MAIRPRSFVACLLLALAATRTTPAQGAFDWTKARPGDVTREMNASKDGDVLLVGQGKIRLPKAARLTRATANPVMLELEIRIVLPDQVVTVENLVGTMGGYQADGNPIRGIQVEKAVHDEKLKFPGVLILQITKPGLPPAGLKIPPQAERDPARPENAKPPGNPAPQKAPVLAPLLPGPESGYQPRSRVFSELAAALSGKYRMPGRDTFWPYQRQWQQAADVASKHPAPAIRKRGEKMLAIAKAEASIDLNAIRRDLLADADEAASRKIPGGKLLGYEPAANGQERPIFASGNEPDPDGVAQAADLRRVAALNDQDLRAWAIARQRRNGFGNLLLGDGMSNHPDHAFQNLVFDARPILEAEAKKHAGARSTTKLIEMTRSDGSLIKVRNAGGKTLTDALVLLNCGFNQSETKKEFGSPIMLFVPVWKADESLELPFEFKVPTVMHVRVAAYANEASREGDEFTLGDPRLKPGGNTAAKPAGPFKPTNLNDPAVIVVVARAPLSGQFPTWVELNGKRTNWKSGEQSLTLTTKAGEHHLLVYQAVMNKTLKLVDKKITIDGGGREEVLTIAK